VIRPGIVRYSLWLGANLVLLVGCIAPQIGEGSIAITLTADGETVPVELPAGSTVDDAVKAAGLVLGALDRTDPPLYTVLGEGSRARVIRVEEEFSVGQEVIPFESQVLRNESLPAGQEYWLQLGENGLQEITIRRVFEDGEEISSNPVKSVLVKEPVPQIRMIGVQRAFAPVSIPGRLVYLLDGDAWVMEGTTADRRQVVTSGDLDGRVFELSLDREWLLFTRTSEDEETINSLWVAPIDEDAGDAIDLGVVNVVHFADWKPGSAFTVAYSTVEPRPGAPGWQANNDLGMLTFSRTGFVSVSSPILDSNSGGIYGWWGTDFYWAQDGLSLAYTRPDEVGILDLETGSQTALNQFTPVQTFGDWAWVPGVAWAPAGDFLFGVNHQAVAESQRFDLEVFQESEGGTLVLTPDVGMFAYPVLSPQVELVNGELAYQIAYLQAIFASQSENSRYRLVVMDRDGSNQRTLFPEEGAGGVEPQEIVWSPEVSTESGNLLIGVIYQNNLWLVDNESGESWQITGDGLTSRLDWK
jgi:resuscitation-promoting factor RpfB